MKSLIVEIDPWTKCNLRCPSCPAGRGETHNLQPQIRTWDLDRWLNIIAAQRKIICIPLYWCGEPFLHPELPQLVRVAKKYCKEVLVFTNGNVPRLDLWDYALNEPSCTLVSVSGWTQETYAKHHRGGSVEAVKHFVRACHNLGMRNVKINYHVYPDSLGELRHWKQYARSLGYPVLPRFPAWLFREDYGHAREGYWLTCEEALRFARRGRECNTMDRMVCLSPTGHFYHCQQISDVRVPRLGHVETTSIDEHIAMRRASMRCRECIDAGWSYFANAHYILPDILQVWRANKWSPTLWTIPLRKLAWQYYMRFRG